MKFETAFSFLPKYSSMRIYFVKLIFTRTYRYLLLAFLSILVGTFLFGGIFSLTRSLSDYFIAE